LLECCVAITTLLKPRIFEKPTLTRIKTNAIEFKALHGIPYVLGAIDGIHILIIAPPKDLASYYYKKKILLYITTRGSRCKLKILGL
jgi:hypothetical protein